MTRRRIILAALALLLAAFVIAVQRDTFVRRWCLPTPPPATRAAGPLDQVIDEFEVDDARMLEKIRELERRSGVRIFVSDYSGRTRRIYPTTPKSGINPAISENHFFVPADLARGLGV
jgi:hypothetical protein